MRRYSSRGYAEESDGAFHSRRTERQKSVPSQFDSYRSSRPSYEEDDFDREIEVTRDFDPICKRRASNSDDRRKALSPTPKPQPQHVIIKNLTNIDVRSLFIGAPRNSVKQSIEVDRLDDELLYSLPPGRYPSWLRSRRLSSTGENGTNSPLDEYDKVDEYVEMDIKDGSVDLACHVRSEKIVPILGSEEMFKKTSMVVTRKIKVDLMVTPTRKSLYDLILEIQTERGVYDRFQSWEVRNSLSGGGLAGLTKQENAEVYRVLMALAELYKMI